MKVALWRLGSGLVALPAQVISLFLVFHGAGEAVGDLYRRLLPPAGAPRGRAREGAPLFGLLLLGIPVAMAMSGAALTMIFTLVRMVYYPFWALSAPAADLRHSWGGPTPAGATLWNIATSLDSVAPGPTRTTTASHRHTAAAGSSDTSKVGSVEASR